MKVINNSKILLSSNIDGTSGNENIAELWGKHFSELFNCVESAEFKVDDVIYNDGVVVKPVEVYHGIGKLAVNKTWGLDMITTKHLKNASYRLAMLLVMCFSRLLAHGILSHPMLSVLLVAVIKDKTCITSSIDNYRPIGLASVLSKVLELILLDRFQEYVKSSENHFGFKNEHGTDPCVYALKELVSNYKRHGTTVFICFLDASKAFDCINHGKLFKLQNRGFHPI